MTHRRQDVGGNRRERANRMGGVDETADLAHHAGTARLLDDQAHEVCGRDPPVGQLLDANREADSVGLCGDHLDRLREALGVQDDDAALLARHGAAHEQHRLANGGRLVEKRRASHGQRRQVRDHRLEVEHRLEATLRDLGLVRRIGRVPGRILEHVAPDHHRT